MSIKRHYKTIVLSDIHLGHKWSKAEEATFFLKKNSCDTLILCGDIIDGWCLMRGRKKKWKKEHTDFIRILFEMQNDTDIIYIRGNHDDFLDMILPFSFQNIKIVEDYQFSSNGKQFFVLHGDVFDKVTTQYKWLSKIGDVLYTVLLNFNDIYNKRRLAQGKTYNSLSAKMKNYVKYSVSFISDFENHLVKLARENNCDGVICGHIHRPEIRDYDGILYLNSGDWVESLSVLTEDYFGNWEVKFYYDFLKEMEDEKLNPIKIVV